MPKLIKANGVYHWQIELSSPNAAAQSLRAGLQAYRQREPAKPPIVMLSRTLPTGYAWYIEQITKRLGIPTDRHSQEQDTIVIKPLTLAEEARIAAQAHGTPPKTAPPASAQAQ